MRRQMVTTMYNNNTNNNNNKNYRDNAQVVSWAWVKETQKRGHFIATFKGPLIIYHLRGRGARRRILGGITWFLWEQREGSVVTENPKGDHWKLWKDSEGGPLKFVWKTKTCGGAGRENHQKLLGGSLQWSNIQMGDRLNFTLFSPES